VAKHRNLLIGPLPVLAVLALGLGVAWALGDRPDAKEVVAREHRVLDVLRGLARAQGTLRTRRTVDRNGDGTAEFGTLEDLRTGGLLADLGGREERGFLAVEGYRVVVLLPRETERTGRLAFATTPADVEPGLASRFFAVAAMPREEKPSGLRAFYLDVTGATWTAEGVCDGERHPYAAPPRRAFVDLEEMPVEDGLVWRLRAGPLPKAPPRPRPPK